MTVVSLAGSDIAKSWSGVFHRKRPPSAPPPHTDSMLDLFFSMLDVRLQSLAPYVGGDSAAQAIIEDIQGKISELRGKPYSGDCASAWNEAYRCERLLCLVEPSEVLSNELDRRIDEATALGLPALERLKADVLRTKGLAFDKTKVPPALLPGGERLLRDSMLNLLEELHWEDQRKFFLTPLLKAAVRRIVWLGLVGFALVLLPYLVLYYFYISDFSDKIQYPDKIPSVSKWVWLPIYTVITAGAFGACFSRLIQVAFNSAKFSVRELESAGMWRNLLLRLAVGMLGAFVLFLFLKSGLMKGNMFPDFTKIGLDFLSYEGSGDEAGIVAQTRSSPNIIHLIMPSNALSLLAIWSFLAGFSERLVPSILANTESSLAKSANIASGQQ